MTRTAVALTAMLALTLAGCSQASEDDPVPTPTPTATEQAGDSESAGTQWAEGVCVATSDLQASIDQLGTSVEIDPTSLSDALDQVRDQVSTQAEAVTMDVEALGEAVTAVPDDLDPTVAAAAEDLQSDRQALADAVNDLQAAVAGLTGADDAVAAARELPGVVEALAVTRVQATALRGSLQELSTAGSDALRAAFANADACGDLLGP